jgi:competence protein ComEC
VSTHADTDHCGALDTVVRYKEIGKVYMPMADETQNLAYADFYTQVAAKECDWQYAKCGETLGKTDGEYPYTLSFIHPHTLDENADSNAQSAVIWLDYNGVSALFTGDVPQETETLLCTGDMAGMFDKYGVELTSTEILKVAHHGSAYSNCYEYLQAVSPAYALIPCGTDNSYGHPHREVTDYLSRLDVEVYRSDVHGHVVFTSDGSRLTVATEKR